MIDDKNFDNLPYRAGVGMMIINDKHQVFVGKRIDTRIEAWQMPQGGIDIGETPSRAALREMKEEISSDKGDIIGESKYWYSYDLAKFLIPKLWEGNYKGQKQKWFLIKFRGVDQEINLNTSHPEFDDWKWTTIEELPNIVIPFKRKLYDSVINEFNIILKSLRFTKP